MFIRLGDTIINLDDVVAVWRENGRTKEFFIYFRFRYTDTDGDTYIVYNSEEDRDSAFNWISEKLSAESI